MANSGLLREYSLVDSHVRKLMMSVKQWAKDYKMNSAKDNSISSYAWINLVVFYLQCLGSVPNLQSQEMMDAVGLVRRPEENYWHFVNKLDTCTIRWDQIKGAKAWTMPSDLQDMPVSALLYGFFEFYSRRFPSAIFAISIKRGNISLPRLAFKKRSLFFCIEDPFETFDSHCPHDLGTPASESATRDILKFFREAEAHLRDVLCGKKNDKGLWPDPPFVEPQSPRDNSKHPRYSHFQSPDNNARRSQEPNQVSGVQPGHVVQQEERGGGEKKMQQTNQYSRRGRNGRQSNQKRRPPPKQNEKNKGQSDDLNERPIQAAAPKEKHNDESSIHMEASRQNNQKGNGNSKSSGKKKGQSNVPKVQAAVPNDSHNNGSRNHKEASRQNDQNGKGNPKSHEGGDGNKKADGKKNYTGPNRRRRPRNQKGNASNQNFQTQST